MTNVLAQVPMETMPLKGTVSQAPKKGQLDKSQLIVPTEEKGSSCGDTNKEASVPPCSHPRVTHVLASRSQMHSKYATSKNSRCLQFCLFSSIPT